MARKKRPVPPPELTKELFLEWRSPRVGVANPTPMNNLMWEWMIASKTFGDYMGDFMGLPSSRTIGPCWNFQRMGQSSTALPDGSMVYIAGEHDDFYDPDFFIYNDVIVVRPDGATQIYGYPQDDFPPTDFHSATLIDGAIVLIGCLGDPAQRQFGTTQVRLLSLDTFAIRKIETTDECPAWINSHSAVLADDGKTIRVSGGQIVPGRDCFSYENLDEWELELTSWRWRCAVRREWQRGRLVLAGRQPNRLSAMRSALSTRESMGAALKHESASVRAFAADSLARLETKMEELKADMGRIPDLDLLHTLYLSDLAVPTDPALHADEYGIFKVMVDATLVRFEEDWDSISVVVEGKLAAGHFEALMQGVCDKLAALDGGEWATLPL